MNEDFLRAKITARKEQNAYRQLQVAGAEIDFCSNDYLGLVKNNLLGTDGLHLKTGSTGSRLLTGNNDLTEETEEMIARFHETAAALIFNSGYDANTGLLGSVPQRGDTVLYDYLSHASIRDGLRLSFARSFSFAHNDMEDLRKKLSAATGNVFVVTESVFSMDGDSAPLHELVSLCQAYGAHLIVDEAHATGIIGKKGEGLVQDAGFQQQCFARIHTFGKALGCHGAAITGSGLLRDYLVNFARSFIYSTALPPASVAAIASSYQLFPGQTENRATLQKLIGIFQAAALPYQQLKSQTPIQSLIIPGNDAVKLVAALCRKQGFDVRAILYPTVPKGSERLRIVLHSFNTEAALQALINILRGNPLPAQ